MLHSLSVRLHGSLVRGLEPQGRADRIRSPAATPLGTRGGLGAGGSLTRSGRVLEALTAP